MQSFMAAASRRTLQSSRRSLPRPQQALFQHNASRTYTHIPICTSCRAPLTTSPPPPSPIIRKRSATLTQQRTFTSTTHHQANDPKTTGEETETSLPKTPPKTHYEWFPKTLPDGPPPKSPFKIDVRLLKREFLQLQSLAHPDKHAPHLKARAEATSSQINLAYKCLQNPLMRAQYLLSLQGIDVAEDETAKVEDAELLMEVLDVRETIEDAQAEDELAPIREANEVRIEVSEARLGKLFRVGDLSGAVTEAVRLRYWVNIRESLDNWEKGAPIVLQH